MIAVQQNGSPTQQNAKLPSPYDTALNAGLDRLQPMPYRPPSQMSLAEKAEAKMKTPDLIEPASAAALQDDGSTRAIIKQNQQLQQDTFQRQVAETKAQQEVTQGLPQRSSAVQGQVQQFMDATRKLFRNQDRVNLSGGEARDARDEKLTLQAGRHQSHRQGNASLFQRLKELSFVTRTHSGEQASRKPKRATSPQHDTFEHQHGGGGHTFDENLAVGMDENSG